MKPHWQIWTLAALSAGCLTATTLWSAGHSSSLVLPQDAGPDKLDVSIYPSNIQDDYKVFQHQCSKCHTLARALNTSMPPAFWSSYMGNVLRKPEFGITNAEATQIYEFLAYDQTQRKVKNPKAFYPAPTEDELDQRRGGTGK